VIPLRDENPAGLKPVLNYTFIALCVLTFLWQLSYGARQQLVIYAFAFIPSVLFGYDQLPPEIAVVPPTVTLFTSMFMHGGWMHLIGNMLYLWIFGDNVEDAMGHVKFVIFYLLCGLAAAFTQALPDPHSDIPMLGASGAISGVLGAYLLLYPHARVLVLVPLGFFSRVMHLPASLVLSLWFVLQFVSNLFAKGGGGVAFRAHIGGFVAGLLLVAVFKRKEFRLFNPLKKDSGSNVSSRRRW
jgi:membrane associated rhomboid family serine protease